jgi:Na+/melibiose symporter-like transporter
MRLLVMTAAYAVLNSLMNLIQTAYYGISAAVAGPNPSNRQAFNINMSRQATVITLITSFIPTLVTVLDFGKWNYFVVATAFMIPMPFALGAISKLADGKDAPVGASGDVHQVSAVDMFKSLGENKYLLVLFLCHTIQYIGQFIFQGLSAYYWMFVVGNFSMMTVANLIAAVTSFVAAMVMPPIGQKIGKKKAISIGYFLLPIVNFCMGYFGRFSYIYMIAIQSLNTFAMYTYTPFVMLMYMDAAEWHYNKTGKDTRGIAVGLATPPMKIGMALGGTIGLTLLANTGFDTPGVAGSAEWIPKFMTITYWVPACFYLVLAILFVLLYRLSDEEAARCAQENYARAMAEQKKE